MIRALLAFALALLLPVAHAQSGPPAPACFPLVNGHPVGMPMVDKRTAAWHVFWLCGDVRKKEVHVTGFSCAKGHCNERALGMVISSVTRASAKVGESKKWWAEFMTVDCDGAADPRAEVRTMCAERASIIEAKRADWKLLGDAWLKEREQ